MGDLPCDSSTYEHHYKRPRREYFATKAPHIKQTDPNLIPGYFAQNIIIQKSIESKTWEKPPIDPKPEEYKDYVEKLKDSKPKVFQLYFAQPEFSPEAADKNAKDLKRTTYQHCYSPDIYFSRKESIRWANSKLDTSNITRYQSTYKTYFRKVQEFGSSTFSTDLTEHPKICLNMYGKGAKTGQTTYYERHCFGAQKARNALIKEGKLKEGPIDRYTLRRI